MRTGRDHYSGIYATQLEAEAKWLRLGAIEKANSVERLVLPQIAHPGRVIELGAGTGAIIAELQRRNFADAYTAVDYSADAVEYMKRNLPNVEVVKADIVQEPISGTFDVVIVSHVLEHLESPDNFLAALVRNLDFRFAVIECPLEDLAASRLKNLFRNRYENLAGHVQFFNRRSLSAILRRHLKIVDFRHYSSWASAETVRFLAQKDGLPRHKRWIKQLYNGGFAACNGASLEAVLDRQLRVVMSEITSGVSEEQGPAALLEGENPLGAFSFLLAMFPIQSPH